MSVPIEHDYIGLSSSSSSSSSDPCSSSMEKSSNLSSESDTNKNNNVLGLKATELRLGLPGLCQDFEENICKNSPVKNNVCGAKRGFSDVIFQSNKIEGLISTVVEDKKKASVDSNAQVVGWPPIRSFRKNTVVGWPPIRSFRKNTMATTSTKNGDIAEGDSGCGGCLYVKVSMDGAPYLRKIDLKTCKNYTQLSKALEKMFNCFILGQCTSKEIRGKEGLSESDIKDLSHRDDCVLTYEDKDGDWMLVGDVPWEMFVDSCKRLRIMKGSEAIGLAPRSMEKSKNQTRGI